MSKHELIFGLPNQTIRITHESINRAAYGKGAIYAAKWLINKPKGMYDMETIMLTDLRKHILEFDFKKSAC